MPICNTQYLFFKKYTLKISTNYPNAGIHTVFPLASGNSYLFWHIAVRRKMSFHDTSVDCSCLMIITSSSQCSLTNVCDVASSGALLFSLLDWWLYVLSSDSAAAKSVRDSDYSAKYLSDFSEKPRGDPSSLNWHPTQSCYQYLQQTEGAWISDSTLIHSRFL